MKGNVISSPTFRFLGVNEFDIDDFGVDSLPYKDEIERLEELEKAFKEKEYGISKDLTKLALSDSAISKSIVVDTQDFDKLIDFTTEDTKGDVVERLDFQMEEGSKGTLILNYQNPDHLHIKRNSLTRIYSKKGSALDLFILSKGGLEATEYHSVTVVTDEDATVNLYLIELGAGEKGVNLRGYMEGKNSTLNVKGIYFLSENEKLDLLYDVRIFGKEAKCNIDQRGVQKKDSKKTFKGTIDFRRGCAKAIGEESEYVTLLEGDCVSRSLPILLCKEEDVVGTHAASAGKIDNEMLFYIMTRGFSKEEAQNLIVMASLSPIIDLIPIEEKRNQVKKYIEERI